MIFVVFETAGRVSASCGPICKTLATLNLLILVYSILLHCKESHYLKRYTYTIIQKKLNTCQKSSNIMSKITQHVPKTPPKITPQIRQKSKTHILKESKSQIVVNIPALLPYNTVPVTSTFDNFMTFL